MAAEKENDMFEIGDYIIYGTNGVCRVQAIGKVDMGSNSKNKSYYTLVPVYQKGSTVFTPVDNDKVPMRPVISEAEAKALVDRIKDVESIGVQDEKKREDVYKKTLRKCDCLETVRIIKTLYSRQQTRMAEGKKVTSSDERYLNIAEDNLYGELALALHMEKGDVAEFIASRVEELKTV